MTVCKYAIDTDNEGNVIDLQELSEAELNRMLKKIFTNGLTRLGYVEKKLKC